VAGIGVLWNNIGKSYLFKSSATLGETRHIKRQVDAAYNAKIKGMGEINGETGEEEDEESTSLIYVPTGVFIQSLEFSSANNVTMTGYIWQKYDLEKTGKRSVDKQGGFKQGVIFPEAVSGDIEEVYRIKNKQNKEELVGWYFEMVLRQPFEFRLYPFDHKNVWLRIWAADFERQVVLIPDIDSYPFLNPLKLPGVEWKENFVLNGWTLVNSFFEYKRTPYNSTFGMDTDPKGEHIPELYFTINLERNFIDAFVTNLVPLIVVLFMLLATLMMVTRNPDKANTFGANPFAILGASSALFFVVLIAHIQLRTQFAVPEIMYLEYFYFVMYVAILTVTVCAFLIISDVKSKLMHLKDGLLPKVLFLPAILLMIYVITFVVFY
jgi:hypothetical protein